MLRVELALLYKGVQFLAILPAGMLNRFLDWSLASRRPAVVFVRERIRRSSVLLLCARTFIRMVQGPATNPQRAQEWVPTAATRRLREEMKLFVCIYDDGRLLPHFLKHYQKFGITEFHVAVPKHLADFVESASRGYNVRQYNDLDVADSFLGGSSAVTRMRNLFQSPDEWGVIVDLDELVEFPEPVSQIISKCEAEGANVARGIMLDRFSVDGQPTAFDDHSDLPSLFPIKARFIREIMHGCDIKGVIVKGHLESAEAHHLFRTEKPFSSVFEIAHYKWNDLSLARVRSAYEMLSAVGRPWAAEYKRVLDHYDAHGRFAWELFHGELALKGEPLRTFLARDSPAEPRNGRQFLNCPETQDRAAAGGRRSKPSKRC
jgi:hypothetical protein